MQYRVEVHEAEVVGSFTVPEGPGPHPGVVALSGSGGGAPGWWGDLLAVHGIAVLAAAYFGVEPLPSALCEIPVETVAAAAEWLRGRPEVRNGPAGLVGGSKGAELALLAATAEPHDEPPDSRANSPPRMLVGSMSSSVRSVHDVVRLTVSSADRS